MLRLFNTGFNHRIHDIVIFKSKPKFDLKGAHENSNNTDMGI